MAVCLCGGEYVQVCAISNQVELESMVVMFVARGAFWEMESNAKFGIDMTYRQAIA